MEHARRAEEAGWDGLSIADVQSASGDMYVAMTLAAMATERILIGSDVTNPLTRHPVVTAGAIASVQQVSGGRAVLGIGRGDSALAHVGRAPVYTKIFESYLKALQAYLRGDGVPFDELSFGRGMAPHVDTLKLAEAPDDSRLTWLEPDDKKVPVAVSASGPRVIAAAARHSDIVMFAVGADLGRLEWGMEQVRKARRGGGAGPRRNPLRCLSQCCLPSRHRCGQEPRARAGRDRPLFKHAREGKRACSRAGPRGAYKGA